MAPVILYRYKDVVIVIIAAFYAHETPFIRYTTRCEMSNFYKEIRHWGEVDY